MRKLEEAIKSYNRYRGAEAKAELIGSEGDIYEIRFTGPFCTTCGFYDWIEDLKYIMEDMGLESEILSIKDLENGAIARFRIKKGEMAKRRPYP